jgi:endonuclease-3
MPRPPTARSTNGSRDDGDIPFALPTVSAPTKRRATQLFKALTAEYPDAHCELNYTSPHELLVATILSAQTTDVGVNKATPALFKRFPAPADYAKASPEEIEPYIKSTGFFRNKAKAVYLAMKDVHERFGDEVPRTMDELLSLHGVARKTANVVLGNAYGINVGFVVDTHIERLSKRFALVPRTANVAQIERTLMALFPRRSWCTMSHAFIWHGRRACKARGVTCSMHPICEKYGTACELRVSASRAKPGEHKQKKPTARAKGS